MDDHDRRVRKLVFDLFLERSSAPALEELSAASGLPLAETRAALRRLDAAHQLKLLEGTDRILMAFPFSALATPYRVTRNGGQRYFANCAWDSIAFHPMLEEPVQVDSFCNLCGEPIRFRLEHERGTPLGPGLPLIHLRLPAREWWKDITRTCSNTMVFVGSEESYHSTGDPVTRVTTGIVTVDQILAMSAPIYSGKLKLEYERPPTETIQATFEQLGLTGPHWKL